MPWLKPLSRGSQRADRPHTPAASRTSPHHAHFKSSSLLSGAGVEDREVTGFRFTISKGRG